MLKVALHNLGCKVNSYETEAMKQLLENNGYEIVPFTDKADVYIVNTCSVTNMADRKSRQMLHKAEKEKSGRGCCGNRLLRPNSNRKNKRRFGNWYCCWK